MSPLPSGLFAAVRTIATSAIGIIGDSVVNAHLSLFCRETADRTILPESGSLSRDSRPPGRLRQST